MNATPISLSDLKPPIPGPCPARGSTTINGRSLGLISTPGGRDDAHKCVVDRPFQGASVNDKFGFIVENMRHRFRHVFAILVSALTHDIPEQDAALEGVDGVFHSRCEWAERRNIQLQ